MHGQAALVPDWPGARLPEFVRDLAAAVIAVMSRDGMLLDANRGFFNLLPDAMNAADILDVRDLFVNPRFDQFATRRAARSAGMLYRGIINLGSIRDSVASLQGVLYSLNDGILMVAEQEVAGLELLRTRVLQLNDDLAEEHRKLAAAMREIKRQKMLAEAALRSRDGAPTQLEAKRE